MALVTPVSASPVYVGDEAGAPRTDNGEAAIANVLMQLGIDFLYEAFLYPIRVNSNGKCTYGFCPDFWISGTKQLAECHIEVTWPDIKGRKQSHPRRHRTVDEVIRQKQYKICQVFRVYCVPTLLLDYQASQAILANPRQLRVLLNRLHEYKNDHDGFYRPAAHHLERR